MSDLCLNSQSIHVLIHKQLGRGGSYFLANQGLHFRKLGMYFDGGRARRSQKKKKIDGGLRDVFGLARLTLSGYVLVENF